MKAPKTRNTGQWTEARHNSFIRSALRQAWQRWGPNHECKRRARVERGVYLCAGYGRDEHSAGASIKVDGRRRNNIFTDHIIPVGPHVSWDQTVDRMFCELDNLQVLCKACHDEKTKQERAEQKK